jgi:uncharacterized protein YcfJ
MTINCFNRAWAMSVFALSAFTGCAHAQIPMPAPAPMPPAQAQDMARVLSSTPVIQKVGVPQQVCADTQVSNPGQKSGAGAAMGAVAGGAVGNAVGHGSGRALATMAGVIGGAILGDKVEGEPAASVQNVRQCQTQTVYQDRVVGYTVQYEYAGKHYTVHSAQEPGAYLPVQVVPLLPGNPSSGNFRR